MHFVSPSFHINAVQLIRREVKLPKSPQLYRRFQFDVHKPRTIRSVVPRYRTSLASAVLGVRRRVVAHAAARSRETNQPNCCGEDEFSSPGILDELSVRSFTRPVAYTRKKPGQVDASRRATKIESPAMWATSRFPYR